MFANFFNLSLLSLALPIAALAASFHGNPIFNRNHHDIAKRADGHVELFKRFDNARWTFYETQTGDAGSCGSYLSDSGFTVAMNLAQMDKATMCYKTITMTYNGKTTTATIADSCPGCPWGGLDLTPGLFSFFADQSAGVIYGQWEFTDGSNNPAPPPPTPTPTTTWEPAVVVPTTTWTPPAVTPTTTWTPPVVVPTTTPSPTPIPTPSSSSRPSSSHQSSSSVSSSSVFSSSVDYTSNGLATPTGTINNTPGEPENLAGLIQIFVQLGGLAFSGAKL